MITEREKETDQQIDSGRTSQIIRDERAEEPGPKRRLHVLFLIDQLCEAGGAERILLKTIRLLPGDRFRCSLATFRLDPTVELFAELPIPAHVFPMRRSYGWSGWQAARKLRRLIQSEQADILHAFHETSDTWGTAVAKLSGCPVVVSSRRDLGILRSAKHRIAYRALSPLFDQVLTVSDEVRSFCIQQDGIDPSKVATLYNGVDLPPAAPADAVEKLRQRLGVTHASPVILAVGHIRPIKGLEVFLQAAAPVLRHFPSAVFLALGEIHDHEYHRRLQAIIREQGIAENVKFLGPSESTIDFLRLADVFCLTSRSEGFSNALLEAMACELPCIATDVGGNKEAIMDGASGFLVPSGDAAATANCILRLLRDPELAKRVGRAARKTVEERFTTAAMMSQLIAVYQRLVPLGHLKG